MRATPDPTGRTGTRTHARTHALNNVQSEPLSKAARKGLKRLNVGTCSSMTLASGFELQLSGRSPCVCTSAFTVICTHSGTAHICWNKPRGRTASRPRSGGRFGRAGGRTGPPAVRTGPGGSPCGPEPLRIQKLSRKTGADSSSSPLGNVGSHFRMQKKPTTNKQTGGCGSEFWLAERSRASNRMPTEQSGYKRGRARVKAARRRTEVHVRPIRGLRRGAWTTDAAPPTVCSPTGSVVRLDCDRSTH